MTVYYILVADLQEAYKLKPYELPATATVQPRTNWPYYVAFSYELGGKVTKQLNVTTNESSIPLASCGRADFQYWVLSPLITSFDTVILGELDKIITFSHTRFVDVILRNDITMIYMVGTAGETVNVSFMNALTEDVATTSCVVGPDGTAAMKGNIYNMFSCISS